jgi:hypothetical protein
MVAATGQGRLGRASSSSSALMMTSKPCSTNWRASSSPIPLDAR